MILADDAERPGESSMLERWEREFDCTHRIDSTASGAFAFVRPRG